MYVHNYHTYYTQYILNTYKVHTNLCEYIMQHNNYVSFTWEHLFGCLGYLHQMITHRNRYTVTCHQTGRKPLLPKAKSGMVINIPHFKRTYVFFFKTTCVNKCLYKQRGSEFVD